MKIKINNTDMEFSNVYYVAVTGNDDTGDGTPGKPFASLYKAINYASSGDAICVLRGKYKLKPFVLNSYTSAGIHDLSKNLFICGENEKTILEFYGSEVPSRDGNLFCTYGQTTVTNLTFNYYPGKSNNYSNSIIVDSLYLNLCNCFIENKGSQSWSYRYNNAENAKSPVVNCVFKSNGKSSGDYSGSPIYYNCLFDSNPSRGSKSNCLTRAITDADLNINLLSADLLNKGSTNEIYNNPDGSTNTIGIFGGKYAWSEMYSYNIITFINKSIGVHHFTDKIEITLQFNGMINDYIFKYKITDDTDDIIIDYGEEFIPIYDAKFSIPIHKVHPNVTNVFNIYCVNNYGVVYLVGHFYIFLTKDKYIVFYKSVSFMPTKAVNKPNKCLMISTQGKYAFIAAAVSLDNTTYQQIDLNKLHQMLQSFRQVKLKLFMSEEAELTAYAMACL